MTSEPRIVLKCADDGSKAVRLTPDDILTLKLIRDYYQSTLFEDRHNSYRSTRDRQLCVETLERILKQVV